MTASTYDRWLEGDCGWTDAKECEACGDEHADETEYDQCRMLADKECQCSECEAFITNEQAIAGKWMCVECRKEN